MGSMRVLIGMQNILDESDERCGTPARMSARMNLRLHLLLCCRHCRGGLLHAHRTSAAQMKGW